MDFLHLIIVFAVILAIRAVMAKAKAAASQPPAAPRRPASQGPQAGGFEEIYNQLRREILAKQRNLVVPPPIGKSAPPLPATETVSSGAKGTPIKVPKEKFAEMLSVAQQAALHRAESSSLATWLPTAATSVQKAAVPNKFFRDRDELRRALVMKEVLDAPLALRRPQESGRAS
jgi:hypothetical protein